ncbi:MAG: PKD domain-containing protein [Bacteroidales bacterium]|nr:PKD domain-containing protein [Bacteroidales bacterium]
MKKIFTLTASALLLTTTFLSCDDDNDSKNDSNQNLKANFITGPKVLVEPNMSVTFCADSIPGDVSYTWDFGDGIGTVWLSNAEYQKTLIHDYEAPGEYVITLTVRDRKYFDSMQDTIKIQPAAPQNTVAGTHYQGCVPYLHQLQSGVVNVTDVKWEIWTLEDGKATKLLAKVNAKTEDVQVYAFEEEGTYLFRLYALGDGVDDYVFMKTDTVEIFPTPKINFECNVNIGSLTTKNTTENAVQWLWDFGDETGSSTEKEPVHQYAKVGEYDVTLKAISKNQCISEDTKHIKVE